MKASRFQHSYRSSASKLHIIIGDTLRDSEIFGGYTAYQEYPVNRVNTSYTESSHHFDWVLPEIQIVIEGHGKQHYEVVAFGGDLQEALFAFQAGRRRDAAKKDAAIAAGYTYIEVPYSDEKLITDQYLWDKYQANKNTEPSVVITTTSNRELEYKEKQKAARAEYLTSDKHQATLEKARQYRKAQYNRLKDKK